MSLLAVRLLVLLAPRFGSGSAGMCLCLRGDDKGDGPKIALR